jgi:hypothetical protein
MQTSVLQSLLLLLPLASGMQINLRQIYLHSLGMMCFVGSAGDVFFARMKGSKEGRGALCVSNDSSQIVAPIYDLGNYKCQRYDSNFLLRFLPSNIADLNPSKILSRPNGWVSDWDVTGFVTKFEVTSTWAFNQWNG